MAESEIRREAEFSLCQRYRYSLTRRWSGAPLLVFVMLNPSTADMIDDDPTIRRCMGFGRSLGAGGIHVVNLFALRSTDPKGLRVAEPIGPHNDRAIRDAAHEARRRKSPVICAWGASPFVRGRDREVLELLASARVQPMCLSITKSGAPAHPLYLRGDLTPIPYEVRHA